jgi:hypothetical protein
MCLGPPHKQTHQATLVFALPLLIHISICTLQILQVAARLSKLRPQDHHPLYRFHAALELLHEHPIILNVLGYTTSRCLQPPDPPPPPQWQPQLLQRHNPTAYRPQPPQRPSRETQSRSPQARSSKCGTYTTSGCARSAQTR